MGINSIKATQSFDVIMGFRYFIEGTGASWDVQKVKAGVGRNPRPPEWKPAPFFAPEHLHHCKTGGTGTAPLK